MVTRSPYIIAGNDNKQGLLSSALTRLRKMLPRQEFQAAPAIHVIRHAYEMPRPTNDNAHETAYAFANNRFLGALFGKPQAVTSNDR